MSMSNLNRTYDYSALNFVLVKQKYTHFFSFMEPKNLNLLPDLRTTLYVEPKICAHLLRGNQRQTNTDQNRLT